MASHVPEAPTSPRSSGKLVRLGRIFGPDHRCVVLPLDHGTILGRVEGLEDPFAQLRAFLEAPCDGFLLGPGVVRRSAELFARRDAPARMLTVDVHWRDERGAGHRLAASVEVAVALGVDAVKLLMPWDVAAAERADTAQLIASVIEDADRYGMPVMVEPMSLQATGAEAVAIASHGCRVAAELGADIVKIGHPGDPELLASWCEEVGVPVVLLGGPSDGSSEGLVAMVADAVAAGVRGIVIGRRVWQRPLSEAKALLGELYGVVHSG